MQESDPNVAYSYVMKSHPRGRLAAQPITNSCNRPYKTVEIDMFTNCNVCICTGWLPRPVGKITDFARLEDIWDNPRAHEIQNDVKDKKFTWCAVDHCGVKHRSINEPHYQVIFAIDDSCNLQCPSCRREKRLYDSGPLYEEKLAAFTHAIELLNNFEPRVHILLSCSGDPLASLISRPLLHSYLGKDTQTFTLFTNGLLIKKQLPKTALFDRITEYRISIDAGAKEVYEKVRLGGSWETLIENFEFLYDNNLSHLVNLMFVVQKNNFRDIPNFVNLINKYNFRGNLTNLDDWATWNYDQVETPDTWTIKNGTYLDNNVLDQNHTLYAECKEIVQSVKHETRLLLSSRLQSLLGI